MCSVRQLANNRYVSEVAELQLGSAKYDMNLHPVSAGTDIAGSRSSDEACNLPRPEWYAAYTAPRHEKQVSRQMEGRQLQSFLPVYRSARRWKDRRKLVELPLFPGYVFVHIALEERLQVLQIPGVVQLVTFQGRPAALPTAEIEGLRQRLAGNARAEPHPYLRTGRRVRVHSGSVAGLEGILVRRKDKFRLVLSIDLIQRSIAVEVDEADVEPVH